MPVRVQLGVGVAQRRRVLIRVGFGDCFADHVCVDERQRDGVSGGDTQRDGECVGDEQRDNERGSVYERVAFCRRVSDRVRQRLAVPGSHLVGARHRGGPARPPARSYAAPQPSRARARACARARAFALAAAKCLAARPITSRAFAFRARPASRRRPASAPPSPPASRAPQRHRPACRLRASRALPCRRAALRAREPCAAARRACRSCLTSSACACR